MIFRSSAHPGATVGVHARDPGAGEFGPHGPSASHPGVVMGFVWSSRSAKRVRRAGVPPLSPSWPRPFRSAWRILVGWSVLPAVGHGVAGSNGRQPHPEAGLQAMITAVGPGGGAPLGEWASGALPLSQALSALPPAATAPNPPPATRQRVVLLPHAGPSPLTSDPPTAAQEGPPP
jgi:hypothetical protein